MPPLAARLARRARPGAAVRRALAPPIAALLALALPLTACKPDAPPRRPLVVFAASSLTEAFEEITRGFEAAHPAVDVQLAFAGSQVLRLQIEQGAAAGVFASANPEHMTALRAAGRVGEPQVFAGNALVVIVPREGSPIERFEQLAQAKRLVIGAPAVPVGRYTRELFDRLAARDAPLAAALRANVVSEEANVRLVRAKVELGEADAAIVYHTDAAASERVRIVAVPAGLAPPAEYVIATVGAADADAAAFVAWVRGEPGRAALGAHGFSVP